MERTKESFATAGQQPWTSTARIAGLRKWNAHWCELSREATQVIVESVMQSPMMMVLDLASGSGEPSLSLAEKLAGSGGSVIATDPAVDALALAKQTAVEHGIGNLKCIGANALHLPFADESFDQVTCRFGVMFFPEPLKALRECRRVLRHGGRAAILAWRSMDQPYFGIPLGVLAGYGSLPEHPPDGAHPFRFAATGKLQRIFEAAGFTNVKEETREITMCWPDSPEQLGTYFIETSALYRPYFDALSAENRIQAAQEICAAYGKFSDGGRVKLPARVVLATGSRL